MEDSKLEEILVELFLQTSHKTSHMLDKIFAQYEHSLRNDIDNLRNDLKRAKELKKKELCKAGSFVNHIDDGQQFIEKELEYQKEKINDLIKDIVRSFNMFH